MSRLAPILPAAAADTRPQLDTHTMAVDAARAMDADWQAELLGILSDLEQRLSGLTRRKTRAWPPEGVRLAADLIRSVGEFAEDRFATLPLVRKHLEAARAEASHLLHKADAVVADAGPEPSGLAGLFSNRKLSPEHRDACFWVLRTLPGALERYLLVLGCGFATGRAAAKWVETCGVFVTQVKRVLAAIEKA